MAKRAKKARKKRLKKQLFKQQKTLVTESVVHMAVEVPASKDELYQKALDGVYGGYVVPLERYINAKATLIHKCNGCDKQFYAKPGWLIDKQDQKHVCYVDSVKSVDKKKRKKISEEEKLELHKLSKAGMSINKLIQHFGISKYMVTKILKEVA